MNNTLPLLRGFYRLTAINADTGEERFLAEFENLITDSGLNGIGGFNMLAQCLVGSGSTPPVNSNNVMEHLIATANAQINPVGGADASGYGYIRVSYTFGAGVAAGNLSEVGVGNTSTLIFSRSLIKDGSGNPTTITVLSNEFFSVVYELRLYPPAADNAFDVTIDGVVHHCILRAANAGSLSWSPVGALYAVGTQVAQGTIDTIQIADGDIAAVTAFPSGNRAIIGYANSAAYVNNSLSLAMATPIIGLDVGNFPGGAVKSLAWGTNMGSYQVSFTPPIPKDNSHTLMLNMAIFWARA